MRRVMLGGTFVVAVVAAIACLWAGTVDADGERWTAVDALARGRAGDAIAELMAAGTLLLLGAVCLVRCTRMPRATRSTRARLSLVPPLPAGDADPFSDEPRQLRR